MNLDWSLGLVLDHIAQNIIIFLLAFHLEASRSQILSIKYLLKRNNIINQTRIILIYRKKMIYLKSFHNHIKIKGH